MAKEYWLKFGSGNPNSSSGLAPTFTMFRSWTGGVVSAPGITQPVASFGLYRFEYSPSFSIAFVVDGATTGLTTADRYISGVLDPLDLVDERAQEILNQGSTLTGIGTTGVAIGVTSLAQAILNAAIGNTITGFVSTLSFGVSGILSVLGTTASSIGSTSVDPGDVFGFLKRLQELQEGNANFNKTTGVWQIQSRGATLLREKTMTDAANAVTKT